MARIMALDYGRKRCGVSVTDTLQIVAGGLGTVRTCDLMSFLKDYLSREPVERLVIGLPRTLDDRPSESMSYIEAFLVRLRRELPQLPFEMYDERFTSSMAHQAMLESGISRTRRQDKALVDQISATIILQSYLESRRFRNSI